MSDSVREFLQTDSVFVREGPDAFKAFFGPVAELKLFEGTIFKNKLEPLKCSGPDIH